MTRVMSHCLAIPVISSPCRLVASAAEVLFLAHSRHHLPARANN